MKPTHKLIKISSTHNNVRTSEMLGVPAVPLELDKRFVINGEPLDKTKDIRTIITTPVITISGKDFWTKNSHYRLEELNVKPS